MLSLNKYILNISKLFSSSSKPEIKYENNDILTLLNTNHFYNKVIAYLDYFHENGIDGLWFNGYFTFEKIDVQLSDDSRLLAINVRDKKFIIQEYESDNKQQTYGKSVNIYDLTFNDLTTIISVLNTSNSFSIMVENPNTYVVTKSSYVNDSFTVYNKRFSLESFKIKKWKF